MRRMPWAVYVWPGLPQLWVRGSWTGLAVAVGAAGVLNLLLLGTFAWSELIAADVRTALWAGLAVAWATAAGVSARWNPRELAEPLPDLPECDFDQVLDSYLKGNWFRTQRDLGKLLKRNPRDLEARLMLATLLRHTGRIEEALGHLEALERFEGARKWSWEIRRERELLAEVQRIRSNTQVEEDRGPDSGEPPAGMTPAA